jgi:hypothetical protein
MTCEGWISSSCSLINFLEGGELFLSKVVIVVISEGHCEWNIFNGLFTLPLNVP